MSDNNNKELATLYASLSDKDRNLLAKLLKAKPEPAKDKSVIPAKMQEKMDGLYTELEVLETDAARREAKAKGVEAVGYVQYPSRKRFLVTAETVAKYKKRAGYRPLN